MEMQCVLCEARIELFYTS